MKISAFADEISDDLAEQIRVLAQNGVGFIELRGVWGKNVMQLSDAELRQVKEQADAAGLGFSAIGSPLGKFPLDGDFSLQMEGLKRAIEAAHLLGAPYIRMFSFYIPEGRAPAACRGQVIDWLGRMIAAAEGSGVTLAHENEKGIYGDTGARCLDLLTTLRSPAFTAVFDFANFVQCGERPYHDCWRVLRPFVSYFHIKDALRNNGQVVPAGQGDGDMQVILSETLADGFDNFLTLEPHLSLAEHSYGRTSPELFATAARAFNTVLQAAQEHPTGMRLPGEEE